ncbi:MULTISPECIES: hypothetical protein [unclassified Paraburkholderia]|uniref:hypothetical protein n=1 Tax=unclassified Paraburkholderia TaxID=2615204 RepID=UPI00160B7D6B|nr:MULTISPECIES: hypothetical protein [unclassified Paraburkholderia]MBB5444773.1 hypothetical protein [Paraburkholderia sp. WSM4177]MBB5484869.1 hypothetical protein [Paraburkholderia sp. WSM4180]
MNFPVDRSPPATAGADAASGDALFSRSGRLATILPRVLFIVTVLYGGALFWIAPRPPLVDLPQHAGQVMLLRALLEHTSPWQNLVQLNLLTPYLVGYGLALPLTYLMPIGAALNCVLMLAYFAFVASCVGFRRYLGGDPRLDWLFVPGFFGFAFMWGFYTFLVATPLGILFMWLSHDYAKATSVRKGVWMFVAGTALFFCHGLVFLLAMAVGVGFVLFKQKTFVRKILALAPFVPLGVLCIAYMYWSRATDPLLGQTVPGVDVFKWGFDLQRVLSLPVYVWGMNKSAAVYLPLVALMFAAPWLWRNRINPDRSVIVPMLAVAFVWFVVPGTALKTAYLYHRFALFLLPAYALMFCAPQTSASGARRASSGPSGGALIGVAVQALIIAGCWIFFADQTIRLHRFAVENAPLDALLSRTEPDQRALSLIFDRASPAYRSPVAYEHQSLWYQAEKRGFVDPNFATYVPQIARFRPGMMPMAPLTLEHDPAGFEWNKDNGRLYRYFFVRKEGPLPKDFFANSECDVTLVVHEGEWSLYERRNCR